MSLITSRWEDLKKKMLAEGDSEDAIAAARELYYETTAASLADLAEAFANIIHALVQDLKEFDGGDDEEEEGGTLQ